MAGVVFTQGATIPMAKRRLMHMPNFRIERKLRKKGYRLVAGVDEAGRGAWAGPLYAAAVILPLGGEDGEAIFRLKDEGVRDGKRITPRRREYLNEVVRDVALGVGVGRTSVGELDEMGVVPATLLAMERAVRDLPQVPDYLLIDYYKLPEVDIAQESYPKGEWLARCIAAASIVAKVARDEHMRALDEQYPEYSFAQHKGYGTARHSEALKKHRPCIEHRRSFRPVKAALNGGQS